MKTNRIWFESVALGTAMACALALLTAVLAAGTAAVTGRDAPGQTNESGSAQQRTYEGMVTCARCGAKHSAKLAKTASNCTLSCVHGGSGFALVDGDKLYQLDGDLNVLKRLAGQRARVVGVMRGDAINVTAIADEN